VHAASANIKPAAIPPEAIERFAISLLFNLSRRKPSGHVSRQAVNVSATQKAYPILGVA
jgi:hypothetical protein